MHWTGMLHVEGTHRRTPESRNDPSDHLRTSTVVPNSTRVDRCPSADLTSDTFDWKATMRHILRMLAVTAAFALPLDAGAVPSTSCPPGQKWLAGICVLSCPAGFEDTGRTCVFRSIGH